MSGGQVAALFVAILLLLPGGCFLVVGIGSLAEGHASSAVAALQIALPILAMAGVLFWLARRRRPPLPGPGLGPT